MEAMEPNIAMEKVVYCKPVNRYLHIQLPPARGENEESTILLPADFKPTEERYVVAKVTAWADDVRFADSLSTEIEVVVDKSMVEEIMIHNRQLTMVQDNYIIGIVTD